VGEEKPSPRRAGPVGNGSVTNPAPADLQLFGEMMKEGGRGMKVRFGSSAASTTD
jgi:hypothetical protein